MASSNENVLQATMTELVIFLLFLSFLYVSYLMHEKEKIIGKWESDRRSYEKVLSSLDRRVSELGQARAILLTKYENQLRTTVKLRLSLQEIEVRLRSAGDNIVSLSSALESSELALKDLRSDYEEINGNLILERAAREQCQVELGVINGQLNAEGEGGVELPACGAVAEAKYRPLVLINLSNEWITVTPNWESTYQVQAQKIDGLVELIGLGRVSTKKFSNIAQNIVGSAAQNLSCRPFAYYTFDQNLTKAAFDKYRIFVATQFQPSNPSDFLRKDLELIGR